MMVVDTRQQNIVYQYGGNLYLNLTNRCSNSCEFCAKWPDFRLGRHDLRLVEDPPLEQIHQALDAILPPSPSPEVVFCGFGEPTERLHDMLHLADRLRARGVRKTRLNTNGQGDLINGRHVAPLLRGRFDAVSVSLNAQDAGTYQTLCRSRFGAEAYDAVLHFIREVRQHVPRVIASVVDLPSVDVDACRRIAEIDLGVEFRLRG